MCALRGACSDRKKRRLNMVIGGCNILGTEYRGEFINGPFGRQRWTNRYGVSQSDIYGGSAAHALRAIGGRTVRLCKDENALHSAVTHDICRDVFTTTHALSLSLLPPSFLPSPALSHLHPSTFSMSSPDVTFRFEFNAGKCTPAKSISCSLSHPPYTPLQPLLPCSPFSPYLLYALWVPIRTVCLLCVAFPRANTGVTDRFVLSRSVLECDRGVASLMRGLQFLGGQKIFNFNTSDLFAPVPREINACDTLE